ncbi:M20/M25/M40 family metallo-hydrolase [Bowmanella sp. Y26]|uniref:M20/M25/M40 family metallo-hydrolase n=1 Tax=Bowmanella yangjiangensis TaxID=2811230 RepID=UPI001BDD2CC0|nr:M20/M25/M40 family metallo-hydrolase [Bowmanella yangjiangensis]MBT1062714.1 M20/M25/M40 family metallo-hydrolase [Bowmanella yangjiangensis]
MKRLFVPLACLSVGAVHAADLDMANKIRNEGFYNSHVMHTLEHLTDKIGSRITNSPQMDEANRWTMEQLKSWGLKNAHLDPFDFGRGWSHDSASINLIAPRDESLHGIPVAWTPGTQGRIEGEVVMLDAVTEAELQQYKGKLKGKILLMGDPPPIGKPKTIIFERHDSKKLSDLKEFDPSRPASHEGWMTPARKDSRLQSYNFNKALEAFLAKEKVAGVIYRSSRQGGLVRVFGKSHRVGETFPVPAIIIEQEDYSLLQRMLDRKETPKLALDIKARFHDEHTDAYNTIAEIPGSDSDPEIVMVGGHLDSWHASDGAVDNGVGVAVAMEAVRILKALDVQPKRTIRIALWSGEEQGLHGSRAYVEEQFATRPEPTDKAERALPRYLWKSPGWPIETKPAYDKLSVYFNMDNGSGRFRGIYTEGNVAVKPMFNDWFGPYTDLSTGAISNLSTGGTDHESFDDVGLPGFQFIQDPLDYSTRLHHTHIDSIDHVIEDDLKQASVIMAGFLYEAAMADERMPRKPIPAAPSKLKQERQQLETEKERRTRERDARQALDTKPYGI